MLLCCVLTGDWTGNAVILFVLLGSFYLQYRNSEGHYFEGKTEKNPENKQTVMTFQRSRKTSKNTHEVNVQIVGKWYLLTKRQSDRDKNARMLKRLAQGRVEMLPSEASQLDPLTVTLS